MTELCQAVPPMGPYILNNTIFICNFNPYDNPNVCTRLPDTWLEWDSWQISKREPANYIWLYYYGLVKKKDITPNIVLYISHYAMGNVLHNLKIDLGIILNYIYINEKLPPMELPKLG